VINPLPAKSLRAPPATINCWSHSSLVELQADSSESGVCSPRFVVACFIAERSIRPADLRPSWSAWYIRGSRGHRYVHAESPVELPGAAGMCSVVPSDAAARWPIWIVDPFRTLGAGTRARRRPTRCRSRCVASGLRNIASSRVEDFRNLAFAGPGHAHAPVVAILTAACSESIRDTIVSPLIPSRYPRVGGIPEFHLLHCALGSSEPVARARPLVPGETEPASPRPAAVPPLCALGVGWRLDVRTPLRAPVRRAGSAGRPLPWAHPIIAGRTDRRIRRLRLRLLGALRCHRRRAVGLCSTVAACVSPRSLWRQPLALRRAPPVSRRPRRWTWRRWQRRRRRRALGLMVGGEQRQQRCDSQNPLSAESAGRGSGTGHPRAATLATTQPRLPYPPTAAARHPAAATGLSYPQH
jgi:hypothetical protein